MRRARAYRVVNLTRNVFHCRNVSLGAALDAAVAISQYEKNALIAVAGPGGVKAVFLDARVPEVLR